MRRRLALVADDDSVTLSVIEQNLKSIGIEALLAHDGAEAVRLFDAHNDIQLILCDLNMPHMGGFDVCRHVRSMEDQHHTPFILFTAEETASYADAVDAGVDDFLQKPLRRNELLVRVQSLLRVFDLQQSMAAGYQLLSQNNALLLSAQKEFARIRDMIVHDLKNPLASLLTNSRYLLTRTRDDERETVLDIVFASENLHRIVDNMTDISKAWERPLTINRSTVNLGELLTKWVADSSALVQLNGRRIRFEPVTAKCEAASDVSILRRALDNLLDNAMRYAPSGSLISVSVQPLGRGEVVVRVSDEGLAVPEAARAELFDMAAIARGEKSTLPGARQGRGMGLVFCKLAVEAHGGRIWIEEAAPKGNAFCFSLPAEFSAIEGAA